MTATAEQSSSVVTLHLDGALCIYNALENKQRVMDALYATSSLELDLSRVEEIDSAGFQLLALAKRESQKLGKTLVLVAHSNPVREVIEFYNMQSFFGDPVIIPAGAGG